MGFDTILGQERPKAILERAIASGRLASYLFTGPRGVGKRTTALVFAQALNCQKNPGVGCGSMQGGEACSACRRIASLSHPDVTLVFPLPPEKKKPSHKEEAAREQEITALLEEYRLGATAPVPEANYLISIDRVRQLRAEMGFKPTTGRHRVVIVLEADRMKPEGANAYLKTLEEPQADTVFILTTARSHSLPITIRSRCQTIVFSRLPEQVIRDELVRRFGPDPDGGTPGTHSTAAAVAEGSLKSALQFIEDPDEFLDPAALDLFVNPPKTDEGRVARARELEDVPLGPFISSLIFLYRQSLAVKLGFAPTLRAHAASINRKAAARSGDDLVRTVGGLLRALRESEYKVNKKIFFFSLLTAVG